ncbi:hypothetical protein FA13DRAFT_1726758 [Coprinellus micaceus]|uniref:Uncharacterized protein n=1 Tax=Coprinellus micaceus TaxID=71717 RepID=A0A4Y7TVQ4_COPMI|nr:hypothetical protein FA13DRAFT_1726758 [Coprinellus micaceus]
MTLCTFLPLAFTVGATRDRHSLSSSPMHATAFAPSPRWASLDRPIAFERLRVRQRQLITVRMPKSFAVVHALAVAVLVDAAQWKIFRSA